MSQIQFGILKWVGSGIVLAVCTLFLRLWLIPYAL